MQYIGELAALSAAFFWATSSFVFTAASIRIGTVQLNLARLMVAANLLALTIIILGIDYNITNSQLLYLSLSGCIGLVVGDTFLFKAFETIGPRISMLVMSISPAISSIIAYLFLDEIIAIIGVVGIVVTLTGIGLVILEKNRANLKFKFSLKGILYAFIGATGQAVGLILAKYAFIEGEMHSLTATFVRIAAAIVLLLPLAYFTGRLNNPFRLFAKDKKAFKLVLAGSILGPYLGVTASFIAVVNIQVGIAATLMSTVPILMIPLSYAIYKEKLTVLSIVGALVAVGGVSLLFTM
jgi:drug/metabolite transporter (DMT)-like permease